MGFVYEHISGAQRAGLGLVVALHHGTYGLVSGLARDLGTSRQFLYRLASRVQAAAVQAVAPGQPGPQPVRVSVPLDRRRLDRAIVTLALAGHASQRGIATCLDVVYGVAPSLGYINGVLAQASVAAARVQAPVPYALPAGEVAADELYVGDQAHLVAVDPHSLLLVAVTPSSDAHGVATAAAWQDVFNDVQGHGVTLRRVASDGGQALASAIARLDGVTHQLDRWHVLRQVGRTERALERAAYGAIAQEEQQAKRARRLDPQRPMGGYVWARYQEAHHQTAQAIRLYDDVCILGQWAREALEALDAHTGQVRARATCLADLQVVVTLLRALRSRPAEQLATALATAGPGLLAYVEPLQQVIATLTQTLTEQCGPGATTGVPLLCAEWQAQRQASTAPAAKGATARRAAARAHLVALLHWGPAYARARALVWQALDRVQRGSSLVECVNSWLRPYADLMKGLGARFLPLFQLYRNAHRFARGKRAGHSPFDLAGVQMPPGDWLAWLGLAQAPLPARRVRALPRVG